jgi:uncharacterized damage-inducible protein DinB
MMKFDVEPYAGVSNDLGVLIATWQDGTREWREYLEQPSVEALVWQLFPNGPSIGGLFLHMASCEAYWLQKFIDGEEIDPANPAWTYDLTVDQRIPLWTPPPREPLDWYFKILDETRVAMIERIQRHADSCSVHSRGDYAVTYRWVLAHLVEHDSYHGGQAVLLHEAWKASQAA